MRNLEAVYDRSDAAARRQLLELSERYGLTSSEMSLVAVIERADDQAGHLPKTKLVPVGMAQDTEFASYFGTCLFDIDAEGPALFRKAPKQRIYAEASRSSFAQSRALYIPLFGLYQDGT